MSDAEILEVFADCERRWLSVLAEVRSFHRDALGKRFAQIKWLPDGTHGTYGWLGFYWELPPFWFGYGRFRGEWLPLIECDIRRCDPAFVLQLESNLPATWQNLDRFAECYWRLWAPARLFDPRDQAVWLKDRSRELHEFSVTN